MNLREEIEDIMSRYAVQVLNNEVVDAVPLFLALVEREKRKAVEEALNKVAFHRCVLHQGRVTGHVSYVVPDAMRDEILRQMFPSTPGQEG